MTVEQLLQFLQTLGISIAEYAVLNHIHFGCRRTLKSLPQFAACPDYALNHPVTVREVSQAVRSCLKRGLIRVISKSDLRQIKRDIANNQINGPVYGFPDVGQVDFTELGASVWKSITERAMPLRRGYAYEDAVEVKTRWTFVSRSAATRHRKRFRSPPDCASISPTVELENIRLAWWSPPLRGWTFDVTEKYQWEGFGGIGRNNWTCLDWEPKTDGIDRTRLRRQLKQCDIDDSELCVLITLAKWGAMDIKRVARHAFHLAKTALRFRIPKERQRGTIRRCLEKGLIVEPNSVEIDRIESAAQTADPPLHSRELRQNDLELSEAGARLLVENGEALLGAAWLDGWSTSRQVFSRVRRYARDFLDIAAVFEEYSDYPENMVKLGPIQKIGPWCLYWWNRFPSGYLVEIELSAEG